MSIPTLFTDWLHETRKLQIESFGKDPAALEGETQVEYVRWNMLAAQDELMEALHEISWKPWASAEFFNKNEFANELVDVLHFVANMLVTAGVTDEDLDERYLAKMQKNRDRQSNGYTGTDKCPDCKRAFDDVGKSEWPFLADESQMLCRLCAESRGLPVS